MGAIFAFPFRVGPSGSVVTTDENSDEGISQLIAAAALTRLGERPLFPTFGITDPVFSEVSPAQLAATLAAYGPKVRITGITAKFVSSTRQDVQVNWQPDEQVVSA